MLALLFPLGARAAENARPPIANPALRDVLDALRAALPGKETVRAHWKAHVYDGPRRRGYDCVPTLQALGDLLEMSGAKKGRQQCSWNYGLQADWKSLTPLKHGEAPEGPAVDAIWARAQLHRQISDLRGCNAYVETLDWLLDRLPTRGVNSQVFCQSGSSYITVSFEFPALPDAGN